MVEWDVFLSHASEDKATVVQPLADGLRDAGLRVWMDAQELTLGDSLRRKVEDGLLKSRFGVVVLSPSFLRKEWPQRELEAILALEQHHGKRLLPVWHELDVQALVDKAPLLADKIGVSTAEGIGVVVREILRAMGAPVKEQAVPAGPLEHPQALVGTTVAGYRLEAYVGGGGSGVVFAASTPQRRQRCALKMFFPLRPGFGHLLGLFDRGFQALSSVRHPNVISVFDHGSVVIDGAQTAFLVTEFIDGWPLDEWALRAGDTQAAYLQRIDIACALAGALVSCHNASYVDEIGFQVRGVLHGDIKPANVLIDKNGSPHLLDFLQLDVQRLIDPRIVNPELVASRRMPTTGLMGTPGFMAPEQERYGVITQATDIYGLAITLTHLFATPNSSHPVFEMLGRRDLPNELKHLIDAAISADPSRRPRTMEEVLSALTSVHEAERNRPTLS